jgi:hypothetical protein
MILSVASWIPTMGRFAVLTSVTHCIGHGHLCGELCWHADPKIAVDHVQVPWRDPPGRFVSNPIRPAVSIGSTMCHSTLGSEDPSYVSDCRHS